MYQVIQATKIAPQKGYSANLWGRRVAKIAPQKGYSADLWGRRVAKRAPQKRHSVHTGCFGIGK